MTVLINITPMILRKHSPLKYVSGFKLRTSILYFRLIYEKLVKRANQKIKFSEKKTPIIMFFDCPNTYIVYNNVINF